MEIEILNTEGQLLARAQTARDTVTSDELLKMTTAVYATIGQFMKMASPVAPVFDGPSKDSKETLQVNQEADE